jgi:hypothetical protein
LEVFGPRSSNISRDLPDEPASGPGTDAKVEPADGDHTEITMSRKSNRVRASLTACGVLLLSSTSWANALTTVHVQPAVLHVPIHPNGSGVKNPPISENRFKHKNNSVGNSNGTVENHFKPHGNKGGNNNGSFGPCRPAGNGRWIC